MISGHTWAKPPDMMLRGVREYAFSERGSREGRRDSRTGPSLPSTFGRRAPLPVTTHALARLLARIVPRGPQSISQRLFNAGQVLTEASQNKFALFAARHFGAKQLEDERIGCLADAPDGCLGSLGFQAR